MDTPAPVDWTAFRSGAKRHTHGPPDQRIAEARASFAGFVRHCLRDKRGRPLRDDAYTRFMTAHLPWLYKRRVHLNHSAPQSLGKTTLVTGFSLWLAGHDPAINVVCTSGTETVAQANVAACRAIIVGDDTAHQSGALSYRSAFPEVVPDFERSKTSAHRHSLMGWRADAFYFQTVGQSPWPAFAAVSVTTAAENRRVDVLLPDDVISRAVAMSGAQCDAYWDALERTWIEGRMASGDASGWCANTGNVWTPRDAVHRLRDDRRFCTIWAGVTPTLDRMFLRFWNAPDDLPLFADPAAFDAEEIAPDHGAGREFSIPLPDHADFKPDALAIRQADKPQLFAQKFQLRAVTDEDLMFPSWHERETFPGTVAQMLDLGEDRGLPVFTEDDARKLTVAVGIDLGGAGTGKDRVTFLVKTNRNKIYPIELHAGSFTLTDFARIIDDAWGRGIRPNRIIVESVGVQSKIKDGLREVGELKNREWVFRIEGLNTTAANKWDVTLGVQAMDNPLFHGGQFVWPSAEPKREGKAGAAWRIFESEILTCRRILKPNETPDSVMSLWLAWSPLQSMSAERSVGVEGITLETDGSRAAQWI